jgi:hypothetical protein
MITRTVRLRRFAAVGAIAVVVRNSPGAGLQAIATQGAQAWTTVGLGLTANF